MDVERISSDFRDLTLLVEGLQIPVHRHVMVTSSKYVAALMSSGMSDSNRTAIDLNGLTAIGVQAVVSFAYTYRVDLNEENVSEILTAAAYLQIDQIVARCDTFLRTEIDLDNYMDILDFTEAYPQLECTISTLHRFIRYNFEDVANTDEFCRLSGEQLAVLLADDSLRVSSEYGLFKSVLKWIHHDAVNRQKDVASVMRNVRFSLFSHEEIWEKVEEEEVVKSNDETMEMIEDARDSRVEEPTRETSRTQIQAENQRIIVSHAGILQSLNVRTLRYARLKYNPSFMMEPRMCVVDNRMYMCGGILPEIQGPTDLATAMCSRYDPRLNWWFRLPDMNQPRRDFVLVAFKKNYTP